MPDGSKPSERNALPTNPVLAAVWMLGTVASFTIMAIAGRQVSEELDTFQLMFYRSALAFGIVALAVLFTAGGLRKVATARLPLHGVRNLVHFVGQFSWFYAITLISLAEVVALEFTFPLWIAVLAPVLLGERLTATRAAAVAIGFAGTMIVLRPGIASVSPGHIIMLVGAVGFALSSLATKRLTATDSVWSILFWMTLIQMPLGLIPSLGNLVVPSAAILPWLVIVAICGISAHLCMAKALRLADAIVVAPMDFMRLPLIAVVGWLLYAEGLDPWVLAGGAVILAGNFLSIHAERRRGSA